MFLFVSYINMYLLDERQLDYSECGMSLFKPFDVRARIVGGEIADIKNWPWAATVWINGRYIRE